LTLEELAATGISHTEGEVHGSENIQPLEGNPVPAAVPESENREDGEIRSGGEDLGDVFSESKVTTNLIKEYEAARFFPAGDGHTALDEQIPTPEVDEVVVFHDFFTCGLRFPCNPLVPAILDKIL
jgi:hypothetical protein